MSDERSGAEQLPVPLLVVGGAMAVAAVVLAVVEGPQELAQATINGLVSGSYFALGAAGLTLVYGVLKLVNFAHGELLTFGAYMALVSRSAFGFPLAARRCRSRSSPPRCSRSVSSS